MVLVWAASPNGLPAYSCLLGRPIASTDLAGVSLQMFAWAHLLSSLKVMYLKWNLSLPLFSPCRPDIMHLFVQTATYKIWETLGTLHC